MTPGISLVGAALILFGIPGTILGWIAAVRIRRSEGKLYGLRLAAAAALPLPMLLIASLLLTGASLVMRFGAISKIFGDTWIFIAIPVLATGLILIIKIFITLLKHLMNGEPIVAGFLKRMSRLTFIAIALIWVVCGGLSVVHQARSEPIAEPVLLPPQAMDGSSGVTTTSDVIIHRLRLAKVDGLVRYLDLESGEVRTADRKGSLSLRSRADPAEPIDLQTAEKVDAMEPPQGAKLVALENDPKVQALIFGATILPERNLEKLLPPPANRFDQFTPQRLIDSKLKVAGLDASERSHYRAFEKFPTAGDDVTTLTIPFETELGRIGVVEIASVDGDPDHVQLRLKYLTSR